MMRELDKKRSSEKKNRNFLIVKIAKERSGK